jgi:putative FmdB family regulatory protein
MPTYEFRCPNGHEFERFYRKISDAAAELPCPECGAVAGRQLSAGAGLLFKGSGFYLTDYGKNAHRKAAPAAGGGAKSGEGKSEAGGGETKSGDAKSGVSEPSGTKAAEKSTPPSKPSGSSGDKS